MKRFLYTLIFLVSVSASAWATHNRAGEITYQQISPNSFTYRITVVTYTYTRSDADRDSLLLNWGDNTESYVPRIIKLDLPDDFRRNVYVANHTFPGAGSFEIFMSDQNRNYGIGNIVGSDQIPFTIKTMLMINPDIGFNNAPILFTEPLDKAAVGHLYIHNAAAYDIDGDSLSYRLTTCLGVNGEPIENYRFPESSNRPISINPITGDLIWDAPVAVGNYNIAFYIEEWRHGIRIGQVLRDMQVQVITTTNQSPVIQMLNDMCVEAGKKLVFDVLATDADNDFMSVHAFGGPMKDKYSKATFITEPIDIRAGRTTGRFEWQTVCENARRTPYQMEFKASDTSLILNANLRNAVLVDFEGVAITVIAPAPVITMLQPTNNSIDVNWSDDNCVESGLVGYKVYRKIGKSDLEWMPCVTGVPGGYGFELIGDVKANEPNRFFDNNDGSGLKQGHWYCYRVVAYYEDGSMSYPSEENCEKVVRGVPVMTNVDITKSDTDDGEVYVAWVKPTEHDVVEYPGPYGYKVYRATGTWGGNFELIGELDGIDNTEFTDAGFDTESVAYNYKVEFYSGTELVSPAQTASTVFIELSTKNAMEVTMRANVPWIDTMYVVYKRLKSDVDFPEDSVGFTNTKLYEDYYVEFEQVYCYYVRALGYYTVEGIKTPIENRSQVDCAVFLDITPPCAPSLMVESDCGNRQNILSWEITDEFCASDIDYYEVFYSPTLKGEPVLLETIDDPIARRWNHDSGESMSGCYTIRAIDRWNNVGEFSEATCIDKCLNYRFPNIFTPDANNVNDVYHPVKPYSGVTKIEFKVYSSWGKLLYKTEDPDINWDGTDSTTGRKVSDGTYYYVCTVYENRLSGVEERHVSGFIQVYGSNGTNVNSN